MSSLAQYENVVNEVKISLQQSIFNLCKKGMYRWNIILDPGIGFAKLREHNLDILKNGYKFLELGFPILYGPSRKKFLGGENPADRTWRTAAAVTASIHQGADIVRVHDVKEMKQVIEVADSIYRSSNVEIQNKTTIS